MRSAIYSKTLLPYSTYKHLDTKWPCTMEDFVIKDSELGSLSEEDSFRLLQANFPLLQIFIQVSIFKVPCMPGNEPWRQSYIRSRVKKLEKCTAQLIAWRVFI
jgi:hypothetical protein